MAAPMISIIPKRIEFLVISKNAELLSVAKDIAEHFDFRAEFCSAIEDIPLDTRSESSPLMTLIELDSTSSIQERMHILGSLREIFSRTQVVVVVEGGETVEDCDFMRGAGAHHLILFQEIRSSSKLYYLAALLIQGTYLPVPVTDLFPSTQLTFNGYHKLSLNQKFLPVLFAGFTFSDKKYRKLEAVKQVYIRRENLEDYRKYIETYHDSTGAALKKRCRATMMTLMGLYSELTLLLVLDSEAAQKNRVLAKIDKFVAAALALAVYLKDCPDVWNVIAQALDFKFCRFERGIYILAYAMQIAQKAQLLADMRTLIVTTLLADIGLLDLPAQNYKNIRTKPESQLDATDIEKLKSHPMASLNRVMLRDLEVSTEVRTSIVCTHERNDQQGFPNQVPADKISLEAKLIHFCEMMDRRVRAALEDGIITHDFVRKQVWEEEKVSLKRFNAEFLDKIEKVLIA
jgi:HD domain-containing protein